MTKKSESNRTFFQIHRACLRKVLPLTFALSPNRPAVPFTAIGAKKSNLYKSERWQRVIIWYILLFLGAVKACLEQGNFKNYQTEKKCQFSS